MLHKIRYLSFACVALFALEANASNHSPSLSGADYNYNGVRDDVDKFIREKYPDQAVHSAVIKIAAGFQDALVSDHSNRELQRQIAHKRERAKQCFVYILDSSPYLKSKYARQYKHPRKGLIYIYDYPSTELERITVNSPERKAAYHKHNKALSGMHFSSLKGNTCD